jgi:uncharacterized protein (TIGR00730 family)
MLTSVCVFCGSSVGARAEYALAARRLGNLLAEGEIRLVYGGANRGLMGVLADACLEAGGNVTGVMPRFLFDREIAHRGLPDLRVVDSMHERKALMADLSGGFIALPGGFGTFEELLEAITWTQLGLQRKPCGVLNVLGYYDALLALAERATDDGFAWPEHRDLIVASDDPVDLLRRMSSFAFPTVNKWVDPRPGDRR